uniref:Autophagy-related protein 13 n=1 Tax=Scleropages formosus TaxID=113540 RepID=A0A8C9W617_SCLFO
MDSHSVLSSQDKKDLDKFIKFFALKTVQVIVQARLGETVSTCSSSSPTGSDWFSLAIKDIPEVTHEAKKVLAGQLPTIGKSMCVEISLKTSEGDSMELETWCLEVNEKCDRDIKVSYTVYNRLSLLLKSLLSITRVTPAYKLSRKQGHDYVILYRIYFGDVQMAHLGEGFRTVCVGVVGTPIGTVTLSCAYRTNLALMSTRGFGRTVPVMGVIIDHFVDHPFGNMGHVNMCNYSTDVQLKSSCCPWTQMSRGGIPPPAVVPVSRALTLNCSISSCRSLGWSSFESIMTAALQPQTIMSVSVVAVVTSSQVRPPESPSTASPSPGSLHSVSSSQSGGPTQDDYILVDFKPAFSKDGLLPMDLGTFYREFQNPPQLSVVSADDSAQSMAEDLDSLPEKLASYEKNMEEFDAFVETLQ